MRTEYRRTLLASSAVSVLLLAAPGLARAGTPVLPTGGKVQAGAVTIGAPNGSSLTVSQTSSKAIVDWTSFSVGQGGSVQFNNGSGATLNRVTGANISSIDGLLSATGSVYLINPNGVIISKTGVVNTGGTELRLHRHRRKLHLTRRRCWPTASTSRPLPPGRRSLSPPLPAP